MIHLKLALAVAIIRKKPPHISSQCYAEKLCSIFLTSLSDTKNVEQEDDTETIPPVSRARYEYEKYQQDDAETIPPKQNKNYPLYDTETIPPEDLKLGLSLKQYDVKDNSCYMVIGGDRQRNATTDIAIPPIKKRKNPLAISVPQTPEPFEVENNGFMQNVLTLSNIDLSQSLSKESDVRCCARCVTDLTNIMSRDVITLPESCLCQAADVIIHLTEKWGWLNECHDFMKAVCGLIDLLLTRLMAVADDIPDWTTLHRKKQAMVSMLVIFMKSYSMPLTTTILETLLEAWEQFCDDLRTANSLHQLINPAEYGNSFFIIQCMERIARQWPVVGCLPRFFLEETQNRLDKSSLHLTNRFMLVARAIWKVTAIIEKLLQEPKS